MKKISVFTILWSTLSCLAEKNVQIVLQGQGCYLINYVTKNVNFYVLLDPRHCVSRGGVSKEQPDREAV